MNAIQKFCSTLLLCVCATASQAIVVQHELTEGAGNFWTAKFEVTNDGSLPEVASFTVYFDYAQASSLVLLASPSSWDTIVVEPDLALASDAFMDALLLDPLMALMPGQTLVGFELQFDWADIAPPTSFRFTVNDANTFAVLESGSTVSSVQSVPEPAMSWIVALGVGLMLAQRRAFASDPRGLTANEDLE